MFVANNKMIASTTNFIHSALDIALVTVSLDEIISRFPDHSSK